MTRGGYVLATRRDDVSNLAADIPGDIGGQQLGQYMLERIRAAGGKKIQGDVTAIERDASYRLSVTEGCRVSG